MAFRCSISIDICRFLSLSLSLSLCVCVCVYWFAPTSGPADFFSPLSVPVLFIYTKNVCVPQLEKHLHQMRKNNWVSLSIQYLVCVYIYIHIHMSTRCARTTGFPSPSNIWYIRTYIHVYIYIYTHTHIHQYTYTYTCPRDAQEPLGFPLHSISGIHIYVYICINLTKP